MRFFPIFKKNESLDSNEASVTICTLHWPIILCPTFLGYCHIKVEKGKVPSWNENHLQNQNR